MDQGIENTRLNERPALASERAFIGISALLFAASAAGTIYLSRTMTGGMAMPGVSASALAWTKLPGQSWLGAAAGFLGMWVVMMAAMMLPSLAYMLVGFRRAMRLQGQTRLGGLTVLAGLGYFLVWAIFGLIVYPFGAALTAAEMQSMDLASLAPAATAVVVLAAGVFQLTSWKAHQLEHCLDAPTGSEPLRENADGAAWRHGLQLGYHCLLCCAGFILVLLAAGVMDLGIMAAVTAAITVERLSSRPRLTANLLGVIGILTGLGLLVRVLTAA